MPDETVLSDLITALMAQQPTALSGLSAGIMASAALGLCADSRSFARRFDVAHALVLRECVALGQEAGLLELDDREDRSLRLFYQLSDKGRDMIGALVPQ